MKVGTTELVKFKKLQRRLGESVRGIVGLLEMLWAGVARNCPRGDIGKFTDEEIAVMCDYEHDPEKLVDALVECKWLDRSDKHRLIVHDWHEHAPSWIKGQLASQRTGFAFDSKPDAKPLAMEGAIDGAKGGAKPPTTNPNQSNPIQFTPTQTNPTQANPHSWFGCGLVGGKCFCGEKHEIAIEIANKLVKCANSGRIKFDRELIWRYSWVAAQIDHSRFLDAVERVIDRTARSPRDFLAGVMRKLLEPRGIPFDAITLDQCPPLPAQRANSAQVEAGEPAGV
jgi:hypothetical protein